MRALGLPNTVQFRDVTRIQDALARKSYTPLSFSLSLSAPDLTDTLF